MFDPDDPVALAAYRRLSDTEVAGMLKTEDRLLIERVLPAHMLFLMLEQLEKRLGVKLRADVTHRVNMAAAAPFADLPEERVSFVAFLVDDFAGRLLNDLSPDDPRPGMLAICFFVLKLVDEKLFPDPRDNVVPISLLLIEEARDDAAWLLREPQLQAKAGRMLSQARKLGLYPVEDPSMPTTEMMSSSIN